LKEKRIKKDIAFAPAFARYLHSRTATKAQLLLTPISQGKDATDATPYAGIIQQVQRVKGQIALLSAARQPPWRFTCLLSSKRSRVLWL